MYEKYPESILDAEGKGLFEKWLDQDTVYVAAVLCDALYVYKRFPKLIQSDQITVFDLQSLCDHCMSALSKLLERPLPGGYEKIETRNGTAEGDTVTRFSDVSLSCTRARKAKRAHLFVTTRGRDVSALKVEIVNSLWNFLCDRLGSDEANSNVSLAEQFKALSCTSLKLGDATDDEIQRAYAGIVPDHDRRAFFCAYRELVTVLQTSRTINRTTLQDILKISLANEDWRSASIAIARVVAAKPHSCDAERLVSAYNVLKETVWRLTHLTHR